MFNFAKPPETKSVWKRAVQAARYTISGVRPESWMSPLQPLKPFAPEQNAWQWDRPVGYNLYYKPRGNERYDFHELREAARQSELIRLAIETRLDQMSAMSWQVKPKMETTAGDEADDNDPRIKTISEFFTSPDKTRDWDQWLRVVLEELFVTDAVSIARRRNKGGGLYALELVDGATIFPLIDQDGRQPAPPDPAFQQILKGVPKANYTSDEFIYYVRKSQVNTPYGFSAVEQIIQSAETDIERLKYTLSYFTEGSVPDAYITAPDGMTADKVLAYEAHLNSILAGNQVGRRQMPILVHGMEMKSMKAAELKNDFDEWLARKVCFAFSLPPTAFIKSNNRATAESEKDRTQEEGLYPVLLYIKRLVDRIIREDFNSPDLEFHWNDDDEKDPLIQSQIDTAYVAAGIKSRNEIRDSLGLDDEEGGDALLVTAGNTLVPLPGSELDLQQKQEQQDQAQQTQSNAIEQIHAKTPAQHAAEAAGAANQNQPGAVGKRASVKKKFYAVSTHRS